MPSRMESKSRGYILPGRSSVLPVQRAPRGKQEGLIALQQILGPPLIHASIGECGGMHGHFAIYRHAYAEMTAKSSRGSPGLLLMIAILPDVGLVEPQGHAWVPSLPRLADCLRIEITRTV